MYYKFYTICLYSGQFPIFRFIVSPHCRPRIAANRGGSLAAGGGIGEARTRANNDVTCSVSYETAPPLAPNCSLEAGVCAQRGDGFTQAGASVRLGREQKMLLPALCRTSLHPRLRETARCAKAFLLSYSN